ncbi:MAG TPA: ACT domain-containing protein [Candidatus Hydrogenedentes bacterium]|nr:ACT domain-containing protein [Candidatus Hydrogenedentota bacterium]
MKLKQLSLFLENKPAHLKAPCRALADAGITILTLSLADADQFGILRLIVERPAEAQAVLEKAGHVVTVNEVVAVEVADRPGGLADLLEVLDEAGINIDYMYAFTYGCDGKAALVFRFEDPDAAIAALEARSMGVLDDATLAGRSQG